MVEDTKYSCQISCCCHDNCNTGVIVKDEVQSRAGVPSLHVVCAIVSLVMVFTRGRRFATRFGSLRSQKRATWCKSTQLTEQATIVPMKNLIRNANKIVVTVTSLLFLFKPHAKIHLSRRKICNRNELPIWKHIFRIGIKTPLVGF